MFHFWTAWHAMEQFSQKATLREQHEQDTRRHIKSLKSYRACNIASHVLFCEAVRFPNSPSVARFAKRVKFHFNLPGIHFAWVVGHKIHRLLVLSPGAQTPPDVESGPYVKVTSHTVGRSHVRDWKSVIKMLLSHQNNM